MPYLNNNNNNKEEPETQKEEEENMSIAQIEEISGLNHTRITGIMRKYFSDNVIPKKRICKSYL